MKTALTVLISYLFGSVPWGLVIGKVFYHKDIRTEGSGNIGGTNAGRVLGKPAAIIVTLLDAFKAFLSMLFAHAFCPGAELLAGLACCIGHCFPAFTRFKGGKAVATTYGFMLGVAVLITGRWFTGLVVPVLCFFGILYACKMVSVASILSVFIAVVISFISNNDLYVSLSLLMLWILVTYRHRSNIERIKNGTENKIKWMG